VKPVPLYDALAADYDRFVNWEERLAHEMPFFQQLLAGRRVRRVLDAACGTGHHAIALARLGYQVLGADLSSGMIERARENAAAAGVDVVFAVAGLGELASLGETFGAALCLGNSLPHLLTAEAVVSALADLASVLEPGGLLVVQNRNFDRVWAARQRFMDPQAWREGKQERIFVRFYDFHEETVTFNMIRLRRGLEGWQQDVESTELRPIFREQLAAALLAADFQAIRFYGSFDGAEFSAQEAGDLIAVARRAG
jgi:glycine/sarcosine N-methyltransferase